MLKYYEQKKARRKETRKNGKFVNGTVFAQQYKENFKAFLISALSLAALMVLILTLYPMVQDMYATMPEELLNMYSAFGGIPSNIAEYFTIEGGQNYILVGCIIAAILGVNLIKKEIKDGSAEFLYSQPVSRSTIFTTKMALLIINIVLFNVLITGICLGTIYIMEGSITFSLINYFLYFGIATIVQLAIGLIAFAYAAMKRRRASVGFAIGITFLAYFLSIISLIAEEVEFLKYATPFTLLQGIQNGGILQTIIAQGFAAVDTTVLIIFSVATVVLLGLSHAIFKRSDIL